MLSWGRGICQLADTSIIPYRQGKLWGYCTPGKKILVMPRFEEASMFYGLLTTVKQDSQYSIINRKGDVLHKSKNWCTTMNDGAHFLTTENSYTEQLFDVGGKPLTKVYNKIGAFNKYGYAQVTSGYSLIGLMDRSFNERLTPAYGGIEFFSKDVVRVYEGKTYTFGLINIGTGKQLATGYSSIYEPLEGLMMVGKDGRYGFMDMNGKEAIVLQYGKETPVNVKRDEHYNESTYEDFRCDGFYEGLAVVVRDGKAGYIDKKGRVMITFIYDKAFGFCNGRAWVMQGGKWGMIDKNGTIMLPLEHRYPNYLYAKELEALDGYHEGLVAVAQDTLWGYADMNGRVTIPATYTRAMPFFNGMAAVYKGDLVGFIDRKGKYVIPPAYKWVEGVGIWDARPFYEGCATALLPDDKWILIDTLGRQIIPYKFEGSDPIRFEDGIAYAVADGITYVFTAKGKILYTFPKGHSVYAHTRSLFFDYTDQCYVNIRTGTKYCD